MMRGNMLRVLVTAGVVACASVGLAFDPTGQWYSWVESCDGTLVLDDSESFLVCEADWDEPSNWFTCVYGGDCEEPTTSYPDSTDEDVIIIASNTGTCDGGVDDGLPCSQNSDCTGAGNTCKDYEAQLVIMLSTETVRDVSVATKSTAATTDQLYLRFTDSGEPFSCTEQTITMGAFELDSTYGKLTLAVENNCAVVSADAITLDAVGGLITVTGPVSTY